MKKSKLILGTILVLTVLLLASLSLCAATETNGIGVVISDGNGTPFMTVYPEGKTFYLPAQVDVSALTIAWTANQKAEQTVLDLSPYISSDSLGTPCYKATVRFGNAEKDYVFYQDTALPAVFIETSKGLPYIESGKENRDKKTSVLILNEEGETEYLDQNGTQSELKSRGNATFGYFKKPYQMKLGAKAPLFGMDAAKTFILLANYVDQTQLHNALAFHLGDVLDVPYNIQYRHVLLYIDGSFRGIYQLCEKVQIDSARVDIRELEKENEKANPNTDLATLPISTVKSGALIQDSILVSYTYAGGMTDPDDITGGYLVELDNVWGASEPSRFTTENGNTYVVKSPEYVSRAQMEYIASLFADMEEAIYAKNGINRRGKKYTDYIDIDSFSSVYAVEEMMKEWDAYQSSMFFFKDADKDGKTALIGMGPLWDFDNSLGNLDVETYDSDTAFLWAQKGKFQKYTRALAAPLMQHSEYKSLVEKKIDTVYGEIQRCFYSDGFLVSSVKRIRTAVLMDRHRWQIDDPNKWVMNSGGRSKSGTRFIHFKSYGDVSSLAAAAAGERSALGNMRDFLTERADALLLSIGSGTAPVIPPDETTAPFVTVTPTTPAATTAAVTTPAETTPVETTPMETTPAETTATEASGTDPNVYPAEPKKPFPLVITVTMSCAAVCLGAVFVLWRRKKQ